MPDLLAKKAPTIQLNIDATRISQTFTGVIFFYFSLQRFRQFLR